MVRTPDRRHLSKLSGLLQGSKNHLKIRCLVDNVRMATLVQKIIDAIFQKNNGNMHRMGNQLFEAVFDNSIQKYVSK